MGHSSIDQSSTMYKTNSCKRLTTMGENILILEDGTAIEWDIHQIQMFGGKEILEPLIILHFLKNIL